MILLRLVYLYKYKSLITSVLSNASSVEVRDSTYEWDQKLQKLLALCSNVCIGSSDVVIDNS
jgi:hypothetical protein